MGRKNYSKFFRNEETEEIAVLNDGGSVADETIDAVVDQLKEEGFEPVEAPAVQTVATFVKGVVSGCKKLHLRKGPSKESASLCVLNENTEVTVNFEESTTEDFYKVCTAAGIEGYCMKKFISIK